MSLNREAIDKQRAANDLPPISDEEFNALIGQENPPAPAPTPAPAPAPAPEVELSDEALMAILEKKTGRKVASWDDLKPAPAQVEEEKKKEDRENEMFNWGLQNKKFDKAQFESFVVASKNPQGLVYQQRLQEALKDDPELNEDEFKADFENEFGLSEDSSPRRKKSGKDNLTRLANDILKSTYSSIYSLDSEYSAFEKQQMDQKEKENKIKSEAPKYKQTLDSIKEKLQKITVDFDENEKMEVEAIEGSIDRVMEYMSNPEWAANKILTGYTEQELIDVARNAIISENFPALSKKIAEQYHMKKAAGTKGILRVGTSGTEVDISGLTDAQKAYVDLHRQHAESN